MSAKRRRARHFADFGVLPILPILVPGLLVAAGGIAYYVMKAKKVAEDALGPTPQGPTALTPEQLAAQAAVDAAQKALNDANLGLVALPGRPTTDTLELANVVNSGAFQISTDTSSNVQAIKNSFLPSPFFTPKLNGFPFALHGFIK